MPRYNFKCKKNKEHNIIEVDMISSDLDNVKSGKMKVSCPQCGSECSKTFSGMKYHGFVAGSGYTDKIGAKRDMERHTLQNNDPYKKMRTKEDKEHILKQLGYNEQDRAWADPEEQVYKICPACTKTMPYSLFERGTNSRCDGCTPEEELLPPPKTRKEHDDDMFMRLNSADYREKKAKEHREQLKKQFKEEFDVDVDELDE